jgi:hypothetical protein
MKTKTLDHMICNDCEATFSVWTEIRATGFIDRRVVGNLELYKGNCPNCKSPRVFVDKIEEE